MNKSSNRGRPTENDTPILEYSQTFIDHTGNSRVWEWDKNKFYNGPISVDVIDVEWKEWDKKEKQLNDILIKYRPKRNQRKPRVTKQDKILIETLKHGLDEIFYSFYPEDRPKKRGRKSKNKV